MLKSKASSANSVLTVAIASDLHAFKRVGKEPAHDPSKLCLSDPEDNPTDHPISGLFTLIKAGSLKADLVLCPGDMTYQADPDGVRYTWERLHKIGAALGATLTVGTAGNHDVDSRGITRAEEPKEVLQTLSPPFPLPDVLLNHEYWARHVTLFDHHVYRLVVLNSCAKHTGSHDKDELERGAVSRMTLNYLDERLRASHPRRINILVCHHHPQSHSELHLGDEDTMLRGQLLIDLLAKHGDWVIVHGHKHHPKISYASGGASWPVVFGAGSFSGMLSPEAETRTRNLFHLVEFVDTKALPHTAGGIVRSWYWAAGVGWKPADSAGMGLPHQTGFGTRTHPREIAHLIAKQVKPPAFKTWDELCKRLPQLNFQLPQDYELTKAFLEQEHKLIIFENAGLPVQVGLAT